MHIGSDKGFMDFTHGTHTGFDERIEEFFIQDWIMIIVERDLAIVDVEINHRKILNRVIALIQCHMNAY